jgi:hypothetical protein
MPNALSVSSSFINYNLILNILVLFIGKYITEKKSRAKILFGKYTTTETKSQIQKIASKAGFV